MLGLGEKVCECEASRIRIDKTNLDYWAQMGLYHYVIVEAQFVNESDIIKPIMSLNPH